MTRFRLSGRAIVFLMMMLVVAAVLVIVLVRPGSPHRVPPRQRTTAPVPRDHVVQAPGRHSLLTPETVGLPSSASGEARVPLPTARVKGWRPVFSDSFPHTELSPVGTFAGCRWSGGAATSSCSELPPAARARWFAFPDGSTSMLSPGVFEPTRVLSIQDSGLRLDFPPASSGLELAGAIPKLGPPGPNTLTSALYVVRFHADRVPGYDFVFNLWPPDNDIARTGYVQFPTGSLSSSIQALVYDPGHRPDPGTVYDPIHPLDSDWDSGTRYAGWHTAVLERTRDRIEFYLDGRPIGLDDRSIPRSPLMLMLQTTPQVGQSRSVHGGSLSVAWLKIYVPAHQSSG